MSSFQGLSSITGLSSFVNQGVAADVTPNAVNWANVTYDCITGNFSATERQITGINQTIALKVTNSSSDGIYYYVSNTQGVIVNGDGTVSCIDPPTCGMTYLNHNDTFTVSNNQYVTFAGSGQADLYTQSVINTSDGNAVLDTFTYSALNCA
jgi:hypothetical protein